MRRIVVDVLCRDIHSKPCRCSPRLKLSRLKRVPELGLVHPCRKLVCGLVLPERLLVYSRSKLRTQRLEDGAQGWGQLEFQPGCANLSGTTQLSVAFLGTFLNPRGTSRTRSNSANPAAMASTTTMACTCPDPREATAVPGQ